MSCRVRALQRGQGRVWKSTGGPYLSQREFVCLGHEKLLEPVGDGEQGESLGEAATPPEQRAPLLGHSAPVPIPGSTYSSLLTTPLPLGSNARKALRMASSGSVPGRPREPGELTFQPAQPDPARIQGAGDLHIPGAVGGCSPIYSASWGSRGHHLLSF